MLNCFSKSKHISTNCNNLDAGKSINDKVFSQEVLRRQKKNFNNESIQEYYNTMFSMYEKYIYEYKKILNKLSTSCRDTEATVQESLDQIFVINRDLKNTIKNIESSNATNQIAAIEMINQLETLNQLENPLVKKQNEIFLLTEQLSERENIFANISIKIKELKKASSRQIIELKSVDSILIKKYQQDELNHCREKISEITKLINSYDAKKKDAEKVHDNLINEIQNINNPKSLLVIPKLNTKENSKEVASKSMSKVDYNSKINGHKADPEISKIIEKETQLEELKAQYEKYLYDNNCLEKECQLRSQELEGKLTKLSTAEIQNQNPTSGET